LEMLLPTTSMYDWLACRPLRASAIELSSIFFSSN
jgi:hypothetical protein